MQCTTESRGLSMEIREESRLKFGVPEESKIIKFDDTAFYRNSFNALPGSKGVDFIIADKEKTAFVEVKNCMGDEGNSRWRIAPNNQKRHIGSTQTEVEERDSLDIEVSQKVAMTLAALAGAKTYIGRKSSAEELKEILELLFSDDIVSENKKKYVILFLEGNFSSHTRSKKMIMSELQRSMNTKLKWLNFRVSVVDSDTYDDKVFQIVS